MRRLIGVLVVIALVTCLPAVGSAQTGGPAPAGQMTWAVHFTLAPRWLDPAESEGSITPFLTLFAVHDALLEPMPSGPAANGLAESWTVSPNGLVYDFTLRPNARFQSGERVTAEDVKFSFERYRGANAATFKERVQEVRVLDARRIQFHLKEPWPAFITFYGATARPRPRGQRGHAPRHPGGEGRPPRHGRAARGAGSLRAPGPRARPEEARGDAAPDPAHPAREEDFRPIRENGFIRGVGPRVEEPGLALIPAFPYSAPYEDVRLKP